MRSIFRRSAPQQTSPGDFQTPTEADLRAAYRLLLLREPDPAGWEGWIRSIQSGTISLQSMVLSFVNSREFIELHGGSLFHQMQQAAHSIQEVHLPHATMFVRRDDYHIGKRIADMQDYEEHVTAFVRRHLKSGQCFVDLGGNIGYFTCLAASIVGPTGHVWTFEPNPDNCELLRMSLSANGFSQVHLYQNAVSDSIGTVTLTTDGSNGWIRPDDQPNQAATKVRTVVLDEVLQDVPPIDLLKIDIEGAEFRALSGMQTLLQRDHPVIVSEFSPHMLGEISQTTPEAYLALLRGLGYDLYTLTAAGDTQLASNEQLMAPFKQTHIDHIDIVALPKA